MSETTTYTACALTDPAEGNPGIGVWDGDLRLEPVACETWPAVESEFDWDSADEALDRLGYRRTSLWEYQSPQWFAAVVATQDSTGEE